ncbi:MAG: hypothetical protein H0T68_03645 [Gemmatimonadales bacterium]|nr:hypothetical protein [Gemmatimonadales bacterium]
MSLWMLTPVSGGRVAVRIQHANDRARRVVLDDTLPEEVREEWRCSRCRVWFAREAITLVESGRAIAGAPEISAYCAPCKGAPRLRGGR